MEKGFKNKRGQIAVFVVIALVLTAIIVLVFLARNKLTAIIAGEPPIEQFKKCAKDAAEQGLAVLSTQGGSINPENYFLYKGNKINYLCYTEENYKQCIMQKPLLKQAIETELETYIQPKINGCLNSLKSKLTKKGYEVEYNPPKIQAELFPNNLLITLNNFDLVINKDSTQTYSTLKIDSKTKLYDLVIISSSIANWEARYGKAEIMNYMMYYPSLKVERIPQDEGTDIYILTNTKTQDKFMFASRSMAVPVGVTGE